MPDLKVPDKVVAASTFVITNTAVAAAPALPNNINQYGGWEVNAVAIGTNALIQFAKLECWFPDLRYARWYSLYLGTLFTTVLWSYDWKKWLINLLVVIALIMTNYPLLNKADVMKAGEEQ